MLIRKEYDNVAELYGKNILPGYESSNVAGIKWIFYAVLDENILIKANNIANDVNDVFIVADNLSIPIHVVQ